MSKFVSIFAFISLFLANSVQAEGDIETGRELSTQCSACHGNDGMSHSEQWPNIAGQKESYLIAQLHKFKSGDRKDPVMSVIVGPLNDQNILDLAAYYASNGAVANYSFEEEMLSIPFVAVGNSTYKVKMQLNSIENLSFSVTELEER